MDARVNRLATQYGDFAALVYTWMIPHATDDGTLTGDVEELMCTVVPGLREKTAEDVTAALVGMNELGLVEWDNGTIRFPREAFYRYQTYIPVAKRRGNGDEQRISPQNTVSPPPSPPPSPPYSPPPPTEEQEDVTRIEREVLVILRNTPGYDFEYSQDLAYIRELAVDFPRLDLLEEVKNWRVHKEDKPLKKNGNHRPGLRTWMGKAVDFGHEKPARKQHPVVIYNNDF